ncbi:MAG: hypothetical protein R6U35_01405 [Candidatus Humimicrobiaceae bacterium]
MSTLDNLDFLKDDKKNYSQLKLLKENIKSGNLSHAFLFSGSSHGYLFSLALNFAAAVNCQNGGCGECTVCKNTLKGIYSNLFIAEAEGNILTVDKIKQIQNFSSLSSYQKGKKIIIVKEAETMNEEASNKLLKTLEDPPDEDCLFVLLTGDKAKLLSTIISRCSGYSWNFIEDESVRQIDFRPLEEALGGGLGEMLLGNKAAPLDVTVKVNEFISRLEKELKHEMAEELKRVKKSGESDSYIKIIEARQKRNISRLKKKVIQRAFNYLSNWLEDIVSISCGASKSALNNEENYTFFKKNVNDPDILKIFKMLELIEKNRRYLDSSINYELALDNILLKLKNVLM